MNEVSIMSMLFQFTIPLLIFTGILSTSMLQPKPEIQTPEVKIVTSEDTIVVQLNPRRAPLTVENFLEYVKDGFYDGTIFHRVIPGFMIQGGGFTTKYKLKKARDPIPNESGNGLSNLRGTIAMAREPAPHTAKAQFYINLVDNLQLDPQSDRWGYAVFGKVISGMDIVDKIGSVPTGAVGPFRQNAPKTQVVIEKIVVVKKKDSKWFNGGS